jgi:hypothetical protein
MDLFQELMLVMYQILEYQHDIKEYGFIFFVTLYIKPVFEMEQRGRKVAICTGLK